MKNYLTVGAILVALVLGVLGVTKESKVSTVYTDSKDGKTLGAFSPYSAIPEVNLGGMRLVGTKIGLATGTSTVCAIQSPAATSTLISAAVEFNLASTSAVIMDLSKSTTQYATSTRIGTVYAIAASKAATIVASSTGSVAGDATIFAPSTWFIGKFYDGNNGVGNASTGSCQALWAVTS